MEKLYIKRTFLRILALFFSINSPYILAQIAAIQTTQPLTATEVYTFHPFTQKGELQSDLVIITRTSGICWTKSLEDHGRSDAWRCQANNLILDPCFHDETLVACITSPWTKRISILEITGTLPKTTSFVNQTAFPWSVELSDGEHCVFLTGAGTSVNDMRVNYACTFDTHIIGDIDRSHSVWFVNLYNTQTKKIMKMPITKAWY